MQDSTKAAGDKASVGDRKRGKMFWAGWVLTLLPALFLIVSGVGKLTGIEPVQDEFLRLGYRAEHAVGIGILELICVALYLFPRTAVLGAILLTGYLGGATATHVRLDEPFIMPVIIGAVFWLGLYLRDARVRALIPWTSMA